MNAHQYHLLRQHKVETCIRAGDKVEEVYYESFQGMIIFDYSILAQNDITTLQNKAFVERKKLAESFEKPSDFDKYPYANVKLNQQQLVFMLESGHKDFRGAILTGLDFNGLDIKGCDFTDAYLRGSSFVGAINTLKAKYIRANIRNTDFSLSGSTVLAGLPKSICDRRGAIQRDLSRSEAKEWNAFVQSCAKDKPDFMGIKVNAKQFAGLVKLGFKDLTGIIVRGENIGQACQNRAVEGVKFNYACFDGATLEKMTFNKCEFNYASMQGVNGQSMKLIECQLQNADMEKIDFSYTDGVDSDFSRASLQCSRLVKFSYSDGPGFFAADYTGSHLSNFSCEKKQNVTIVQGVDEKIFAPKVN